MNEGQGLAGARELGANWSAQMKETSKGKTFAKRKRKTALESLWLVDVLKDVVDS